MTTSATAGTGNEIGTDFRLRVVIVKGSSVFVQPVNRFPYHDVSGKHEQRLIVVWLGFVNTGVDVLGSGSPVKMADVEAPEEVLAMLVIWRKAERSDAWNWELAA